MGRRFGRAAALAPVQETGLVDVTAIIPDDCSGRLAAAYAYRQPAPPASDGGRKNSGSAVSAGLLVALLLSLGIKRARAS